MPQAIGELIVAGIEYLSGPAAAGATATTAGGATIVTTSGASVLGLDLGGTILGVQATTIIGTVVLTGLYIATQPGTPQPAATKVNIRQAVSARRRGYGYGRLGGTLALLRRSLQTGDGILYEVVCLHSGEIDALVKHYVGDQVTRVLEFESFSGILDVQFPAIPEGSKPAATSVIITAYDTSYVLPSVVAHYTIGGSPVSLAAISVGIVGGAIVSVVFPYTIEGQKPLATSVTFTIGGTGTGAQLAAKLNGNDLWDGGLSPSNVEIVQGGTGYTNTAGGFGAYLRPRPNGHGLWDGGGSPENVAIDAFGQGFVAPNIQAHYGATTLNAISYTIGSFVGSAGVVNYPPVWFDNQRVTILHTLGKASQVSNNLLQTAFPGGWTDRHRLDGIAYSMLKLNGVGLQDFNKVYKAGIPTYTAVCRLSKIWDPRAEGQTPFDPSTWTWSDNAALVILDYLWHKDGMRLPLELILAAQDDWRDAADFCDEPVSLLNGDCEARYRLWAIYDFTDQPKAILSKMLSAVDGRLRLREDGAIVLDLGKFDCPTACELIQDKDILSYSSLRRGANKSELKNEITATYLSEGHNYVEQEADPWRDQDSIDLDGLQTSQLDLTYCPSHRQARRRMKVEAARLNPEWQGTIVTNAVGLRLLGKRYARFRISDLGLNETFFIKQSEINLLKGGVCTFEVISFPESAYTWNVLEEGVSPENETSGLHAISIPEGATSVRITCTGGGGGGGPHGTGRGGGGGGQSIKTIILDPTDFESVIIFTVGAGGFGAGGAGADSNGINSSVTGSLTAGDINMIGRGGSCGSNHGTGGTATGGDLNTSGHNNNGGHGGKSASGALSNEKPGGGGDLQLDGADGSVVFEFTY